MLRTCVLCCAMAGIVGLTVGCNLFSSSNGAIKDRDEAVKTLKAKLDELDKQLVAFKEKADKATGDEKGKLEAKHKDATATRDVFAKKLKELETAAADKWEAVKKDAEKASDEAKKAMD